MTACPDKAKYVPYESKEDELIKALNNDLKVQENTMEESPKVPIDPWCTNIKLMQQYEIKDWYNDSYNNQPCQVLTTINQNNVETQPGDMEIESQKGWANNLCWGNDDGWGNDSNENNIAQEAGFGGGVPEEKPFESANVGTW